MALTLSEIEHLFAVKGDRQYTGEPVTQLEHALQCAQLAEGEGADAPLVVAALLHDLGHMLNDQGETPTLRGIDDKHQFVALPFLRGLFDEDVLEPIRLHVDAKRYLCAVEPGYWDSLSIASRRSLELQGGIYDVGEAQAFIAQPHARDAVQLRRWDDEAKVAGLTTPDLAHYVEIMRTACRSESGMT
jgi:phosphonate degradation associated HDIG domain protein